MSDYNKGLMLSRKCTHPKVLKLLQSLAPTSPMAVPRDEYQPREGIISRRCYEPIEAVSNFRLDGATRPVATLNLDSTLLKRRKTSQNFS